VILHEAQKRKGCSLPAACPARHRQVMRARYPFAKAGECLLRNSQGLLEARVLANGGGVSAIHCRGQLAAPLFAGYGASLPMRCPGPCGTCPSASHAAYPCSAGQVVPRLRGHGDLHASCLVCHAS